MNNTTGIDQCSSCGSSNILIKNNKTYQFKGQVYTKNKWEELMCDYIVFNNNLLIIRYLNEVINPKYLKAMFLYNITKATKLRLILPSSMFLILSLLIIIVNLIIDSKANFGLGEDFLKMRYFSIFIAVFLMFLSLLNFIRVFKYKVKVIKRPNRKRLIYSQISQNEYLEKIIIFDNQINKEK